MAKTPNSNSSSYLTAAEFLKRKDWRTIADLCSDDDRRPATAAAFLADATKLANLQALLDDAAGMVEAACLKGNCYTPEDLAALTGVGQKLLYRLIADLTEGYAIERRPDRKRPTPPAYERALELLDMLATGQRIFPTVESMDAGNPEIEVEDAAIVEDRALTTYRADRFFGRRNNRIDP